MPAPKSLKAPKVSYRCTECGWSSPKWMGQCRECREWGTLEEVQSAGAPGGGAGGSGRAPPRYTGGPGPRARGTNALTLRSSVLQEALG